MFDSEICCKITPRIASLQMDFDDFLGFFRRDTLKKLENYAEIRNIIVSLRCETDY